MTFQICPCCQSPTIVSRFEKNARIFCSEICAYLYEIEEEKHRSEPSPLSEENPRT